jgi:hypothetical protein
MEALRESEWMLLEWRRWALSTGNLQSQEERAVGGVEIFMELSQESSRSTKIQNPEIVWSRVSVMEFWIGAD